MKKLIYILSLSIALFFCADAYAQMAYKLGSGTSGSSFLFGSTSAKRTQLIYLPGDFNGSLSGAVNKLYFMYNSTTSPEYTNLVISLGQTDTTAFNGTTFFTGLNEVLNAVTYTIPSGVAGEWFSIALTSNFTFDATKTLIVEVKWDANTQTGFSTRYGSSTTGKKLCANDPAALTGSTYTTWQNFGYDIQVSNNMTANAVVSPAGLVNTPSVEVKAAFQNTGLNAMSGMYYVQIYSPAKSMLYADSAAFTNVPAGQIDTVLFANFAGFVGNGAYTVKAVVTGGGDQATVDDTTTATFNRFMPTYPMIVSWTSQSANGISNKDSALAALNALGVMYDEYDRNILNISSFTDWRTLLWLEDASILADELLAVKNFLAAGSAQYQNSLILFGDDVGYYHDIGRSLADSVFFQGYLHAKYFADDPQAADQTRICGVTFNVGLCDSLNSLYPDAVGVVNGGLPAYRFADLAANSDTVCGVVFDGDTYNTAYFPFEIRELVQSVSKAAANQVVNGVINWTINVGGSIPVELTSLTANVNGSNVTINWKTATETNNKGFAVERKTKSGTFDEIGFVTGYGTTTERKSYTFTDTKLDVGSYTYRLKQIDFDGTFKYTDEVTADVTAPKIYSLEQNYPNPFNPATKIKYAVPFDGFVNLTIYNALGEKVTTLVQQIIKAGNYEVDFNASSFASGIYFYRMEAGNFVSVKKMMLIK
ncbi:MAG: T9SS type A sorting domain-containing protein [Ignavibacteriaceae bacterium]|nr:T9SS type A sorting domain-containing protein [Ignavibacteriaceae bacterium]